jgi:hypothetical protein
MDEEESPQVKEKVIEDLSGRALGKNSDIKRLMNSKLQRSGSGSQ